MAGGAHIRELDITDHLCVAKTADCLEGGGREGGGGRESLCSKDGLLFPP